MKTVRDMLGPMDEAMKEQDIYDAAIDEIAQMTDRNDHMGAILAGANLVGAKGIAKKVDLLMKLHALEGEMADGLVAYANYLRKQVYAAAKSKMDAATFEKFRRAF